MLTVILIFCMEFNVIIIFKTFYHNFTAIFKISDAFLFFPPSTFPLSNWHPWPVSGGEIKWRISCENNINLAYGLSKVCVLSRRKTDRKVVQSAAGTGPNTVDITPGGTCLAGVAFGAAKKGAFFFGFFFGTASPSHHHIQQRQSRPGWDCTQGKLGFRVWKKGRARFLAPYARGLSGTGNRVETGTVRRKVLLGESVKVSFRRSIELSLQRLLFVAVCVCVFVYVRVCARKKKVPSSSAAEGRLSTGRGGPTERRRQERVSEKVTGLEKQFCVPRVCLFVCDWEKGSVVVGGRGWWRRRATQWRRSTPHRFGRINPAQLQRQRVLWWVAPCWVGGIRWGSEEGRGEEEGRWWRVKTFRGTLCDGF